MELNMLEIRRRFADPRRTEITKIVEDIDMDDIIQEEDMVVTCTHHGYIKRIAEATYRTQRRGGVGISAGATREEDFLDAAPLVRIQAPIPGKAAIGIEIPNKNAAQVLLREVIESKEFQSERSPISFALGKDIAGRIVCANLEKMPHLLIAGATGSGKSVCINDILLSTKKADITVIRNTEPE